MDGLCDLHKAIGNVEECPHGWCAFWEREGTGHGLVPSREAVVEPGCAIRRMGIDLSNVDLAYYLLDLRRALETAHSAEEAEAARHAFGQVRPPGL
jgi:hypothetical protein